MVKPKKRGRPATGRDPLVGVRMPPAMTEALDRAAAQQEDKPTRSEMLRKIAGDWLTERGFLKAPPPDPQAMAAKIERLDAKAAALKHDGTPSPENAMKTMDRALVKGKAHELRKRLSKTKDK